MSRVQPTPLSPVSKPLSARLEDEASASRVAIESLAQLLRDRKGWMGRKKLLSDHLAGLDAVIRGGWLQAEREGLAKPADAEVFASADEQFGFSAPMIIGAALELLAETEISSVEQAACYIVSSHQEHHDAAFAYLQADPARLKAWRKLLRADRRFSGWLRLISNAGAALEDEAAAAT